MANLSWVTPTGTIANILIGTPFATSLLATDETYSSTPIQYTLISGELPPGITLTGYGAITGTPVYATANDNYFTTRPYTFTVRAVNTLGQMVFGTFKIIITNSVNHDYDWVTTAGTLGTVPEGEFINLRLQAQDTVHSAITYKFIAGTLPPGTQILETDKLFNSNIVVTALQTNSTVISLSQSVGIPLGAAVTGDSKIPAGTVVTAVDVDRNTVTISNPTTSPLTKTGVGQPGLNFSAVQFYAGTLIGVPTITSSVAVDQSVTYQFTVRATNALGHINDRTFDLTVTNVTGPVLKPDSPLLPGTHTVTLGSFFDGSYYTEQLLVPELNPAVVIEYKLVGGNLPPGITLSSNGLLSGYLEPYIIPSALGPQGYDGDYEPSGIIVQQQEYDYSPYDFTSVLSKSINYSFTIRAFDGANYVKQNYEIGVLSRTGFTVDATSVVDSTSVTVDSSNIYTPVILNKSTTLPAGRQGSYYAVKILGIDFQNDPLGFHLSAAAGTYDAEILGIDDGFDFNGDDEFHTTGIGIGFDAAGTVTSFTNLPGLTLDETTGWLYGKLLPQTASQVNYKFGVYVTKLHTYPDGSQVSVPSQTTIFTLPILGDVNNTIVWTSPEDLGTIDNGLVSELSLVATSTEGRRLLYTLLDTPDVSCRLPQGLKLVTDSQGKIGMLTGRVTFEAYSVDDYATTFDGNKLTMDRKVKFTVTAATEDGSASSTREFTLTVNVIDTEPHNDLYLQAMPAYDQKQIYTSVIGNSEIFPDSLIYRSGDPEFGIQPEIKMLFLPGLNAKQLSEYAQAMAKNHYVKDYTFGDIKTAVVLDDAFNIKYEVVYIEMLDPAQTGAANNLGPGLSIELIGVITNPYHDAAGNQYFVAYPNTSTNMTKRLEAGVGYQDQSTLPPWMTSNQPGTTTTTFSPPLGFTKAVVMAYTQPGASKLIAYRLRNSGINFNSIKFSVDRYRVDDYYSTNYTFNTKKYKTERETTFDYSPKNIGNMAGTVQYAVSVPFSQINGRTVDYINGRGGLDGKTDWINGDTIIFAKQEQFATTDPNDGWIDYFDAYIGDNISTSTVEGYDTEGFDYYTNVPGYYEKITGSATVNQRAGIWQVQIVNNVVSLVFLQEVLLSQRIRVNRGANYTGAILFYNPITVSGQTTPGYSVYNVRLDTLQKRTTFNGDSTRFFSYRDQHYTPGSNDKYLRFPQDGVFT